MLAALERAGGGTPLVIGDRLETDIAGAAGLGWDSLLVLTGITQREDLAGSLIVPTFVGDDLSALFAPPARLEAPRGPGVCWPRNRTRPKEIPMTTLEEVRKSIEAVIGNLTPAKAQELAKSLSDPGTAKEQVSKLAADMLVWSQRSRERLKEFVSREVSSQMNSVGVATQADLDAVKKRVRDLERARRHDRVRAAFDGQEVDREEVGGQEVARKSDREADDRPHPRDRLRAPSAARRRARAPGAGEQSGGSAGRGGRGAGDRRREPGDEGRHRWSPTTPRCR